MKKTKVYRPRRGLHFSDDLGPKPKGGFIGSAAVTRTRKTSQKTSHVTKVTDSLTITGGVMRFAGGPAGSLAQSVPFVNPMAGVTFDATSGKYVPQSWTEWQTTLTASNLAGGFAPYGLYLCQETTGSLADSIGGAGAATAFLSPQYQMAVSGWTRKGVSFSGNSIASFLSTTNTAVSFLGICYTTVDAGVTNGGSIMGFRGNAAASDPMLAVAVTGPHVAAYKGGASATGTLNPTASHRPFVVLYDKTNSRAGVYTDQEIVSVPYSVSTGAGTVLGGTPGIVVATTSTSSYWVEFKGTAAEMTDAQIRNLLRTLGWSVAW